MFGGRYQPKRPSIKSSVGGMVALAALITLLPMIPIILEIGLLVLALWLGIKLTIWFWK